MVIKRIKIENFKRFSQFEVELKPLDCLVGGNNSGKTTLLQAIALLDFCIHTCLSRKSSNGSSGIIEVKNRSVAPEDFVVLPATKPLDLWTDRTAQKANKHILIAIEATFDNNNTVKTTIDLNFNRFSIYLETDDNQEWLLTLAQSRISYLPVFSTFLTQEVKSTSAVIEDALIRGRVNSVIRNLLLDLKEKEGKINELEEILRRAFPSFNKLKVEFDEISDRFIDVSYYERGKRKEFDIFMAGSGFQQFLYLFGFILLRNPSIILLDEPDVHLHGTLQDNLLQELKRIVEGGKQVIFATHSRDLITHVDPEQIVHLFDGGYKRLSVAFDIYDALEDLGSIDNIQLAQIQAFKRLIVLENDSDWRFIQIFGNKIIGESIWQDIEKRLGVFYAKGNPTNQNISRLRQQISTMLSISGSPLKMFVISDRDYYPEREELMNELSQSDENINWHVWDRNEIENYLLNQDAIIRVANIEGIFRDNFLDEYRNLLENSKQSARDKLISAFEKYGKQKKTGWDAVGTTRKAEEFLFAHWQIDTLKLADAKDIVLPGLKNWLQRNGFKQFSDVKLAEHLTVEELPEEIHMIIKSLAQFAGVNTN